METAITLNHDAPLVKRLSGATLTQARRSHPQAPPTMQFRQQETTPWQLATARLQGCRGHTGTQTLLDGVSKLLKKVFLEIIRREWLLVGQKQSEQAKPRCRCFACCQQKQCNIRCLRCLQQKIARLPQQRHQRPTLTTEVLLSSV